ncbi:hypothetical protein BELL_0018g00350 [Botrytis elliptica]|uniref:2EXR domain-containing protein n=1 Tax=Botrytis elliptica TaxID=278938 RepID=A0A4Z1K7E5_9HELO|nr:hypothetical protein EAE99_008903 [Botrytis elliptica]TGO79980.1 hypothetical protein BELL_0018g00350 [Botrytis elliptica]
MTDHTPGIISSYHNKPREMKLEDKTEKDLDSSSHLKDEGKEKNSNSDGPHKNNILDLIRSSTSGTSHQDSQELRDQGTENEARSAPFDRKTETASRKERFYELVAADPLYGITSSTLDFIYATLEDENLSKNSELSDKIRQAFSALEDELFNEDEEAIFERFPKLPPEVRTMIWKLNLLEPKVVRVGIVPTERTIEQWQYCAGDLMKIDGHMPMLLERNSILKTPPCSLLSVNRESRDQALQVHGVFWEQRRPCEKAEGGYVSINRIYVNWEIDTLWLDYNISVAWRDNKMDPSDILITPMPAYDKVRRLATPGESIEWPCDYQVSDTGLAIADFPNLEELFLLVPTKETEWSDPILVPTPINTKFCSFLDKFDADSLGSGIEFFFGEDEYDIITENLDIGELRDNVYFVFQHTLENFASADNEEEIEAGYIRDLSTWEWPDVRFMEVSTIEKEKVKVIAEALLEVLPAGVYEVDDEDTDEGSRGPSSTSFYYMLLLRR